MDRARVLRQIERDIAVDGRERAGKIRRLAPRFQFFTDGGRRFADMRIDVVQIAELTDEGKRRLFPDPGDAGDVVGSVAH